MIRFGDHRAWARAYGRGARAKPQRTSVETVRAGADSRPARAGFRLPRAAGAALIAVVVSAVSWALLIALIVLLVRHQPFGRGG